MNQELLKTIDNLIKTREKNLKNIEKYKQDIKKLTIQNKQIDGKIKKLETLKIKYDALDKLVNETLNPSNDEDTND